MKPAIADDPALAEPAVEFSQWLLARKPQWEGTLLFDPGKVRYRRMLYEGAAVLARLSPGEVAHYLGLNPWPSAGSSIGFDREELL